jgi:hypothetical protein
MIPKSGYRFLEKIMLKQEAKAKWRFNIISFRFSRTGRILRRQDARSRNPPIARFVLALRSAKIGATPDLRKLKP